MLRFYCSIGSGESAALTKGRFFKIRLGKVGLNPGLNLEEDATGEYVKKSSLDITKKKFIKSLVTKTLYSLRLMSPSNQRSQARRR